MCGRFALGVDPEQVAAFLEAVLRGRAEPRWNIAPTQEALVARVASSRERVVEPMRWGLVPSWAKDPSIGNRMINARSEEAAEKPSFRAAMRRRRCLVPAQGFYEWQAPTEPTAGRGARKQPWFLRPRGGGLLAFAGLWEVWRDREAPDAPALASFTILTTAPNAMVRPIHDRMPVIVAPHDFERWLDPANEDPASLAPLLAPASSDFLEAWPVSTAVNSPRNEGPELVERVGG